MAANRVGLVTGGSRGVGRATSVALARAGYSVVACGRDEQALAKTSAELEAAGGDFATVLADVGRREEVERLVRFAVDRFGRIDVLVNNAGAAPRAPIDQISPAEFDAAVAVNIGAVFHATRCAWPVMRAHGGGTIVNISSLASVDPFPGFQVYGATKAWVNLFTKAVADEGRAVGIRAFALALGAVETQMLRGLFPEFPADQALEASDVADLVVQLTSNALRYASGTTIAFRK